MNLFGKDKKKPTAKEVAKSASRETKKEVRVRTKNVAKAQGTNYSIIKMKSYYTRPNASHPFLPSSLSKSIVNYERALKET